MCPGSSDHFYVASLLYKMGHYFLDILYMFGKKNVYNIHSKLRYVREVHGDGMPSLSLIHAMPAFPRTDRTILSKLKEKLIVLKEIFPNSAGTLATLVTMHKI